MRRSAHGKPTGGIWLRPAYHIGTMISLISRFRQARPVIPSRMMNYVTYNENQQIVSWDIFPSPVDSCLTVNDTIEYEK